jgi:predicted lipoprotein
MKQPIHFLFLALTLFFISGCTEESSNGTSSSEFDRSAMLENMADNVIMPAYTALNIEVQALNNAASDFSFAPDAQKLSALREQWLRSAEQWQNCNAFNFGPASDTQGTLLENIGTFPADIESIEGYISAVDTSLANFNRDSRGFYGMEYLIFGNGISDDEILTAFAENTNRAAYLRAVSGDISERVAETELGWTDYRISFIENDGTDVGSSVSMLYNEFVKSYESIKNFKLGLPLGLRAGQTDIAPELVEARFSGHSRELMRIHLAAIEEIYSGKNGIGFDDYLRSTEGGEALAGSIDAQVSLWDEKFTAVPSGSLAETIRTNPKPVIELHTELQKGTRFFKSDMSSLLGISITFNSGDGD